MNGDTVISQIVRGERGGFTLRIHRSYFDDLATWPELKATEWGAPRGPGFAVALGVVDVEVDDTLPPQVFG